MFFHNSRVLKIVLYDVFFEFHYLIWHGANVVVRIVLRGDNFVNITRVFELVFMVINEWNLEI
jgi:hypothetical protein